VYIRTRSNDNHNNRNISPYRSSETRDALSLSLSSSAGRLRNVYHAPAAFPTCTLNESGGVLVFIHDVVVVSRGGMMTRA